MLSRVPSKSSHQTGSSKYICILEAYDRTVPQPLSCPITAFGGKLDRTVPLAHIGGWRDQTTASFTQILIDEDHLYLQSAREHPTGYIRETLQASACQPWKGNE
jgi:surfactin synthase thioesterase subunit